VVVVVVVAYYTRPVFQYRQEHRIQSQLVQAVRQLAVQAQKEPAGAIQHLAH
jgi:hypothetical protein